MFSRSFTAAHIKTASYARMGKTSIAATLGDFAGDMAKKVAGATPAIDTRPTSADDSVQWTTNTGAPVYNNRDSLTAGKRGPVLLEDFHLLEKLGNFDREKIPERVVHARGATAKGVFTVTQDVTDLTCADFLSKVGKETDLIARLSTVVHERGSPEALRDVRGFSVKFYTQQGNYDIVGNNIPVFFIRDGMAFPDMVHALRPNPKNHIQEFWRIWDFFSHHPESTAMFTWLLDDAGIPKDFRHMPGFGVHTFSMINSEGKKTFVKFHWVSEQGVEYLMDEEAVMVGGANHSHATQDLYDSIEAGDFPAWTLKVQTMDPATQFDYDFDPLDATKEWPETEFPLREVGRMVLNRNVDNFHAENESLAFSPSNVVPGIGFTEDKLLQSRLFSYADTQRYRLGSNYLTLPVNQPRCPFHNNNFDGAMNTTKRTEEIDYFPSTFVNVKGSRPIDEKEADPIPVAQTPIPADADHAVKEKIEKEENFKQAGVRFRSFDPERQERFVHRVAGKLTSKKVTKQLQETWVGYFRAADESLGERLAAAVFK